MKRYLLITTTTMCPTSSPLFHLHICKNILYPLLQPKWTHPCSNNILLTNLTVHFQVLKSNQIILNFYLSSSLSSSSSPKKLKHNDSLQSNHTKTWHTYKCCLEYMEGEDPTIMCNLVLISKSHESQATIICVDEYFN